MSARRRALRSKRQATDKESEQEETVPVIEEPASSVPQEEEDDVAPVTLSVGDIRTLLLLLQSPDIGLKATAWSGLLEYTRSKPRTNISEFLRLNGLSAIGQTISSPDPSPLTLLALKLLYQCLQLNLPFASALLTPQSDGSILALQITDSLRILKDSQFEDRQDALLVLSNVILFLVSHSDKEVAEKVTSFLLQSSSFQVLSSLLDNSGEGAEGVENVILSILDTHAAQGGVASVIFLAEEVNVLDVLARKLSPQRAPEPSPNSLISYLESAAIYLQEFGLRSRGRELSLHLSLLHHLQTSKDDNVIIAASKALRTLAADAQASLDLGRRADWSLLFALSTQTTAVTVPMVPERNVVEQQQQQSQAPQHQQRPPSSAQNKQQSASKQGDIKVKVSASTATTASSGGVISATVSKPSPSVQSTSPSPLLNPTSSTKNTPSVSVTLSGPSVSGSSIPASAPSTADVPEDAANLSVKLLERAVAVSALVEMLLAQDENLVRFQRANPSALLVLSSPPSSSPLLPSSSSALLQHWLGIVNRIITSEDAIPVFAKLVDVANSLLPASSAIRTLLLLSSFSEVLSAAQHAFSVSSSSILASISLPPLLEVLASRSILIPGFAGNRVDGVSLDAALLLSYLSREDLYESEQAAPLLKALLSAFSNVCTHAIETLNETSQAHATVLLHAICALSRRHSEVVREVKSALASSLASILKVRKFLTPSLSAMAENAEKILGQQFASE